MTRTAGAPMGCQRPSRFWGLGCPKIYHEAEDTLVHSSFSLTKALFGTHSHHEQMLLYRCLCYGCSLYRPHTDY
ncbi:hypothetical protein, partial [Thiolapillus sp.]|uniref:hypothetical protein n=1 Tax=Thiolapillus sp. TaxID=2017437 RepID=UPI003AF7F65A